MRLRTRRSLTNRTVGTGRECVRHARSMSGIVVERHTPRERVILFFKRLCARTTPQITRPRIDSNFGSTPILGPLYSRFTLVHFQAWKVDGVPRL